MGIGSANPLLLASAADDSDPVTRSLRFNDNDTAYLSRTFSSAGDGQKFTISMWVKLGSKSSWDVFIAATASSGSSNQDALFLDQTTGKLIVQDEGIGHILKTTRELRDPSGWYHLCYYLDTTQSSASDRLKLYINGVEETSFDTDSRSSITGDSYAHNFNKAGTYRIGNSSNGSTDVFDGCIADVYFIDGAAISPVGNFIEDTGYNSYKPKAFDMSSYSGNSFHLKFEETGVGTGSSTTVGADSSGQDNHFDSSGIVASDVLLDTPTKNYATWNPLRPNASMTYAEGNLAAVSSGGSGRSGYSTFGITSGKWYFESLGGDNNFGLRDDGGSGYYIYYNASGSYNINGSTVGSKSTYTTTDIISCAVDFDAETFEFYKNGIGQGQSSFSNTGISALKVEFAGTYSSARTCYANFGQDPTFAGNKTSGQDTSQSEFYDAPPEGFKALCSANFDDPTVKAHENFNTITYGGTASSRSLGGVGFQPNMTWIKQRSSPVRRHHIQDSARTAGRSLFPDADTSEEVSSNYVTSFDSDGFSLGISSETNGSSIDYVAWNWKENASAGFDIVTWAGNADAGGDGYSEQTVSHSLGVAPEMIIAKARSDSNLSSYGYEHDWCVYHKDLTSGYFVKLNETDSETQHDGALFSAIGTSSLDFGNDTYDNQYLNYAEYYSGTGEDYVAYLFTSVDGVCKVGSYTGNASADGPTVYCGFRPAFVMVKRIANSGSWYLWDNKRGPHNVINNTLYPNSTAIESGSGGIIDFTATGFKLRSTATDINSSGEKRIFLAMAESPLKYANAR